MTDKKSFYVLPEPSPEQQELLKLKKAGEITLAEWFAASRKLKSAFREFLLAENGVNSLEELDAKSSKDKGE